MVEICGGRHLLISAAARGSCTLPLMDDVFYDRAGRVIPRSQWLRLLGQESYRVLAVTETAGRRIVTAWLGQDQSGGFDDPLIFGTVVHDLARDEFVHEVFSGTQQQALLAHESTCRQEIVGCAVCAHEQPGSAQRALPVG